MGIFFWQSELAACAEETVEGQQIRHLFKKNKTICFPHLQNQNSIFIFRSVQIPHITARTSLFTKYLPRCFSAPFLTCPSPLHQASPVIKGLCSAIVHHQRSGPFALPPCFETFTEIRQYAFLLRAS